MTRDARIVAWFAGLASIIIMGCAFMAGARADQLTRAQVQAEIQSELPSNQRGAITAELLRDVVGDLTDSAFLLKSDAFTGDCSNNILAFTCTKVGGVAFGYFATGTDASHLTGFLDVSHITGSIPATIADGSITYVKFTNGTFVGDCANGATFICTKSNGVAFGPFATQTSAANLTGTIPAAVVPASVIAQSTLPNLTNADSVTLPIATPVYAFGAASVKRGRANAAGTSTIVGLYYTTSVAASSAGLVVSSGSLTATTGQWDAVASTTGGLTPGVTYFLDPATPGKVTSTVPTTAGFTLVRIGTAVSSTIMVLRIGPPILL